MVVVVVVVVLVVVVMVMANENENFVMKREIVRVFLFGTFSHDAAEKGVG